VFLIDSKTNLKTPILLINTPHANTDESAGAPDNNNVIGNKGTRIVFSCTWNENRKNENDEVKSA